MCCDAVLEVARVRDGARVVEARCAVKRRDVAVALAVERLREALALGRAGRALGDHLVYGTRRARILYASVVVARGLAVVVLHQARVAHAVVGRLDAHAAARLLHDDGQDEAMVDARRRSGLLDAVINGALDVSVLVAMFWFF